MITPVFEVRCPHIQCEQHPPQYLTNYGRAVTVEVEYERFHQAVRLLRDQQEWARRQVA